MTDNTRAAARAASAPTTPGRSPWPALWALVIGFFMILVDTTIVSVANPAIKAALDPDSNNLDNVVWVTSAYLLAYAVPLLITGRLGDRFGPKRIYLIGLVVFTLASLMCGLSGTLELLIIARAVQGLGAALMTPQTMAVITRTFPPDRRGAAMGLWGATAGVATLVGPLAGGLLVDGLGWEWIFFINVPVGIVAFVMAWIFVPHLPTHPHRFDIPGVILSAVGLFLIVFGLQEGDLVRSMQHRDPRLDGVQGETQLVGQAGHVEELSAARGDKPHEGLERLKVPDLAHGPDVSLEIRLHVALVPAQPALLPR